MASTDAMVRVKIGWEEVEPDGSKCFDCGDACYLSMVQAYYQIEGQDKEFVNAVLCGGCDEMRREPDDAGEEWKQQ
jgi:hypothetical protein